MLFVSNLAPHVTEHDLRLLFEEIGAIKFIRRNTQFNESLEFGWAVLVFERNQGSERSDQLAVQMFNGIPLDGQPLSIEVIESTVDAESPPTTSTTTVSVQTVKPTYFSRDCASQTVTTPDDKNTAMEKRTPTTFTNKSIHNPRPRPDAYLKNSYITLNSQLPTNPLDGGMGILVVDCIPVGFQQCDLFFCFSKYGRIVGISKIISTCHDYYPCGVAYIQFLNDFQASRAIQGMHMFAIAGFPRPLIVRWPRPYLDNWFISNLN